MGLTGKLFGRTELKFDGNMLYEMLRYRPKDMSVASPEKLREVALHESEWGKVGSYVVWRFILDGEEKICKEVLEDLDEKNKTITYKVVEGDLLDIYKSFTFITHFDTKGGNNMVRMTLEYEKAIRGGSGSKFGYGNLP